MKSVAEKTVEQVVNELVGDHFDLMDRKELTAYARENKTGILIRPSLLTDDIRNHLRMWKEEDILLSEESYVKSVTEIGVPVKAPTKIEKAYNEMIAAKEAYHRVAPANTSKPKAAIILPEELLMLKTLNAEKDAYAELMNQEILNLVSNATGEIIKDSYFNLRAQICSLLSSN